MRWCGEKFTTIWKFLTNWRKKLVLRSKRSFPLRSKTQITNLWSNSKMLQNLCKEYCIMKVQSTFIQHLVVSQDISWDYEMSFSWCKGGKGEWDGENFQVDQLPSVFPLFLNWAAYQKFKVFRRFSNQLGSVSMNWVGEWDISAEEYPESFIQGRDLCSKLEWDQPIKLYNQKTKPTKSKLTKIS